MSLTTRLRTADGRRACAIALAAASTALALVPAAARADAVVEAEELALSPSGAGAVITNPAASSGAALKIWSNGAGSGPVFPAYDTSLLIVRARGQQCGGAPRMVVSIDGVSRLSTLVSSTTYTAYSAPLDLPEGTHTLKVAFTNDHLSRRCDRNLIVDQVRFVGDHHPTIPPPLGPAPEPTAPVPSP